MEWFMPIYTSIVGVVVGLLIAWIRSLVSQQKQTKQAEDDRVAALSEGMAILLRSRLLSYYYTYKDLDSIPVDEWSDIEQTHVVYNKLGGNHTGDRIFDILKAMTAKINGTTISLTRGDTLRVVIDIYNPD